MIVPESVLDICIEHLLYRYWALREIVMSWDPLGFSLIIVSESFDQNTFSFVRFIRKQCCVLPFRSPVKITTCEVTSLL